MTSLISIGESTPTQNEIFEIIDRHVWKFPVERTTMVRQLSTFKGYVIDVRTRKFRKMEPGQPLEFIDFASAAGMDLILEMEENPKEITTFQGEDPNEVAYMADKAMRHEVSNRRSAASQAAKIQVCE